MIVLADTNSLVDRHNLKLWLRSNLRAFGTSVVYCLLVLLQLLRGCSLNVSAIMIATHVAYYCDEPKKYSLPSSDLKPR